jgi:uncharacterized protein YndB with AHSA1/START domain
MTDKSNSKGIDSASRVIKASPETIYRAFLDKEAVVKWRPPEGMKAIIYKFEPHQGGKFRMAFEYTSTDDNGSGKTSQNADVFEGSFLELIPNKRIVELVKFESDDPSFDNEMKITTTLVPVSDGTEVRFSCEDVPDSIRPEDHQAGMKSSLQNLAALTE